MHQNSRLVPPGYNPTRIALEPLGSGSGFYGPPDILEGRKGNGSKALPALPILNHNFLALGGQLNPSARNFWPPAG